MNDSRTRWLRAKVPPYVKHGAGAAVAPDPVPAEPSPEWAPIPLFHGPAENWARIAFGWLELANITHGSQRDDYRARVRANLGEARIRNKPWTKSKDVAHVELRIPPSDANPEYLTIFGKKVRHFRP